jgi:hypothetical protein
MALEVVTTKLTFHEGKACDAVLRRIVERERQSITDPSRPEMDRSGPPIDLVCKIGGKLFAFEHTGIEPFEGHIQLDAQAATYLKPIEEALAEQLRPQERADVTIPWNAFLGLNGGEAARLSQALISTVVAAFPDVGVDRPGRRVRATRFLEGDLPFEFWIHRSDNAGHPGRVRINYLVPDDLEEQRVARLQRGYMSHIQKLAGWKKDQAAHTVLILEENDVNVTNEYAIVDALRQIELDAINRPDEVWLVSTAVNAIWFVHWLRIENRYCEDFSVWGNSLSEIDPDSIINLTNR